MKAVKESEKRFTNSYKCTTNVYNKAMKRAKKEKRPLSQSIEQFVRLYSEGYEIGFLNNHVVMHPRSI